MSDRLGWLRGIGKALIVTVVGVVFLFPLYWIVTMAFKPQEEWQPIDGVHWVPDDWTLENFKKIFGRATDTGFFEAAPTDATNAIVNSIVAATGGTILAMLVGTLTAYGIARYKAGGGFLPFQILQLRMFPPVAIVIPLLIMYAYLELVDTYWGLILIYGAVTFPFVVWLMRSFFQEVPREIAEAAIVDGCSQWGALFKAVLPQVRGGLAATALFVFILNWSDFLLALVLTSEQVETAPVFLNGLQSAGAGQEYGPQAALGLVLIIPPAILGLAIQRYLVRGLTFGAVKR